MYIPRRYAEDDINKIISFIRANAFGILVSISNGIPVATHIPFFLIKKGGDWFLSSHISKGNAQKNSLTGSEVLIIFQGPNAYISPTWYTELNVPTWNYIAVHAYGEIRLLVHDETVEQLRAMVDTFEEKAGTHMKMEEIPSKTFQNDLSGIVAFEMKVNRFEAAYKLSQNRDHKSFDTIIEKLSTMDPGSRSIGQEMKGIEKNIFPENNG